MNQQQHTQRNQRPPFSHSKTTAYEQHKQIIIYETCAATGLSI